MASRQDKNKNAGSSEDSVEQVFGGDYSESTLDILRSVDKAYIDQEEALNPEKQPFLWALQQLDEKQLPPGAYEAAKAYVEAKIDALKQLRERGLDPEHKELIDYKRSLVAGKATDEVNWLKFKAYHRAQQQLKQEQEEELKQQQGSASTSAPAPFTGEQFNDELSYTAYSEESEWAPDWQHSSYLPSTSSFTAVRNSAAARVRPPGLGLPRVLQQVAPGALKPNTSSDQDAAAAWKLDPVTVYNPAYLEEQRLQKQLRQQRAARRNAFLLSLAAVVGVGLLRWWRKRQSSKGNNGKGTSGRKPVPV